MDLIEGINKEIKRCEELVKIYNGIPTGAFGAVMIRNVILKAKLVLKTDDIVEMVKVCKELQGCK